MRILILGGTVFLGRALTDAALARGHPVTHLNRGRSSTPDARVQTVHADRTDDAALRTALGAQRWDAVIDTSGYLPQVVRGSVDALRGSGARYVVVSSISVYGEGGFGEDAPVAPPLDPLPDAMTPETYGALKAMCEAVVREGTGEAALIVRPGLIVGPHDPTDRFTYWTARIARGGRVLAPGRPGRPVQFIYVRDLADWMVRATEQGASGTFNATGPAQRTTMGELLEACARMAANGATLEWVDDAFLTGQKVGPWNQMPLWLPDTDRLAAGFLDVPLARALAAGLAFRPLEQTIRDTLAWSATRPAEREWKAGLGAAREQELLELLQPPSAR